MKKRDIDLIIGVLVLSTVALFLYWFFTKPNEEEKEKTVVVVTIEGLEYGRYSLYEDQTIEIPARYGASILVIQDGEAKMVHAGCPDQICVYHTPISFNRDMIVCIPNEIIVKIDNGAEPKMDGVAQ